MLAEFGCRYALVGHSERRQWHAETDCRSRRRPWRRLEAALRRWCASARRSPSAKRGATPEVVVRQLDAVVEALGGDLPKIVLAYEPVWAIGTGRTATPEQAQEVHALLRGASRGQAPRT